MQLDQCRNWRDFRQKAKRALPAPLFHYIDGAADDEWSIANNTQAFSAYEFVTDVLNDISDIDTRTRVLGADISVPFFLSPTGMSRLFHHGKEPAVARAAHKLGTMYSLSTIGTTTIADVAKANPGPNMYQVYILKDRGLARDFVARAKDAGFTSLCLTVDTPVPGNRERDYRTGMIMPPKFTLSSLASFAAHPKWAWHYLLDNDFAIANVAAYKKDGLEEEGAMGLMEYINTQFDKSLNWKHAEWLATEWGGPIALKGITSARDALKARDAGYTALMLSNHGGRQLDGAPAPVDCIRPIRDAIGDSMEVIVDGGIRRGVHVLKALALGADAVSFGRPYLYALAAGGHEGVVRMLQLMRDEVIRGMQLLGVSQISDIEDRHVRVVGSLRA